MLVPATTPTPDSSRETRSRAPRGQGRGRLAELADSACVEKFWKQACVAERKHRPHANRSALTLSLSRSAHLPPRLHAVLAPGSPLCCPERESNMAASLGDEVSTQVFTTVSCRTLSMGPRKPRALSTPRRQPAPGHPRGTSWAARCCWSGPRTCELGGLWDPSGPLHRGPSSPPRAKQGLELGLLAATPPLGEPPSLMGAVGGGPVS